MDYDLISITMTALHEHVIIINTLTYTIPQGHRYNNIMFCVNEYNLSV